jgi:hypothetical protein
MRFVAMPKSRNAQVSVGSVAQQVTMKTQIKQATLPRNVKKTWIAALPRKHALLIIPVLQVFVGSIH